MAFPAPTDRHRLADEKLGGEGALQRFVADRRSDGKSWRSIERELFAATAVDVTGETLRLWFAELLEAS